MNPQAQAGTPHLYSGCAIEIALHDRLARLPFIKGLNAKFTVLKNSRFHAVLRDGINRAAILGL
jgi:hypothetical protein